MVSFSPRKQNLTLYLMGSYIHPEDKSYDDLFGKLGKHKLADVDMGVLEKLVRKSFEDMKAYYPS